MRLPAPVTTLVAAFALAFPAGAAAQGAGDGQYSDPFGSGQDDQQQSSSGSSQDDSSAQSGGGDSLAPSPPSGPGSEAEATTQERRADELARTGAAPGLVALLGAGLILTGVGLRVREPLA